jgi:hypothetical protein
MPVPRHPPPRSWRAARTHRAPASGVTRRHPKVPAVRSRAHMTGFPALRPTPGVLTRVPLDQPPSLYASASPGTPRLLFGSFADTMGLSNSLHPCLTVVPLRCTVRTWRCSPGQRKSLPGSAHSVSVHVRDLRPRQVCPLLAIAGGRVAFRVLGARRHPGLADCGAQYSACTFPCQRFVPPVAKRHT